jgi:hypothetical protein
LNRAIATPVLYNACIACLVLSARPVRAQPRASFLPDGAALRGVTIGPIESSQQSGRGYGSDVSRALLDELVRLGVNAISITPFGRIWSLQSTQIERDFELPFAQNQAAVLRLVADAKARGLRVLIVPHLWVETPGWRGDFDPGSEAGWLAYQKSYREFVLDWAKLARRAGADALSIGVECKSWSGRFGAFWSALIADVRAAFPGQLTYSANWDEADDVLFWDQLDFVGINAFYPLADHADASYATYAEGAARAVERAMALGRLVAKPIVFVEIGYTTRRDAAVKPWLWPDDMHHVAIDEWEQARALSALMGAAITQSAFRGLFVWRYYANLDDISQEASWGFSPHGKLAEPLLSNVFQTPWAGDPDPTLTWRSHAVDHAEPKR